ncbi:MAG: hypothetical protein WCQ48_08415, partial [Chloroflexota bacterium]
MCLEGILTRARNAGNVEDGSPMLRALLRLWRRGGLLRTGIMLVICGLLLAGMPMPFHGLLMPVTMLLIGEAEQSSHASSKG